MKDWTSPLHNAHCPEIIHLSLAINRDVWILSSVTFQLAALSSFRFPPTSHQRSLRIAIFWCSGESDIWWDDMESAICKTPLLALAKVLLHCQHHQINNIEWIWKYENKDDGRLYLRIIPYPPTKLWIPCKQRQNLNVPHACDTDIVLIENVYLKSVF